MSEKEELKVKLELLQKSYDRFRSEAYEEITRLKTALLKIAYGEVEGDLHSYAELVAKGEVE